MHATRACKCIFIWSCSYPVSFLPFCSFQQGFNTNFVFLWHKQKPSDPPALLFWHKMKCVFPQRKGLKVPVLMEVLVRTKWGAKTISVGSCVNFCRVKAVQVQRGCLEVSISWYRGPLQVASECKPFCCGMGLVGLIWSSSSVMASKTMFSFRYKVGMFFPSVVIKCCYIAAH